MRLEKGEISSSQLMFLVAGFIQGSTFLVAFVTKITKQDTWLVVLSGFMISLCMTLIYIALAQKFPGKNLMQINDIIYGKYLGKLISATYILYFLSLVSLNLRFFGDFFTTYLVPETPLLVFLIMLTFICAWAVRSGIEVIARISVIFVVISSLVTLLTFVFLLKDMRFSNFLPVFELSLKDFIQGTHIIASIPFCEIVVFLMVIPYMNKVKQVKSSVLLGLVLGGVTLLTDTVRNTAVLGITTTIMVSPSYEAVRLINIAEVITRLELLVAIVLLVMVFLKVSVFYYATVLGIAQLFRLRSYRQLILPIGIICIGLALYIYDSSMEQSNSGSNIHPTSTIPFEFLIPLVSLLLAKIRGLPRK